MKRSRSRGPSAPKDPRPSSTASSTSSPGPSAASSGADPGPPRKPRSNDGGTGLQLRARALTLEELDRLHAVDLLAFVRADERPLLGLAGLLDWRLCGALTATLKKELFAGAGGEALLTIPAGRLAVSRIFLYGLGDATGAEADRLVGQALEAVARAGAREVAMEPPPWGDKALAVAAQEWVRQAHEVGLRRLVLLTEDPRAMDKALAVAESTFSWAYLED